MKIAVTGPNGRLASWLISHYKCAPLECDITDFDSTRIEIQRVAPDAIIHAAAYTDVDKAEEEIEESLAINVRGTGNVRMAFDGYVIYLSTPYIFSGGLMPPYKEEDEPSPIGQYGWSKWGGEAAMLAGGSENGLIARTTSLYGNGPQEDFVSHVLKGLETGLNVSLPTNLISSPTYIPHLSIALLECIKKRIPGILNLAGETVVSRHGWGVAVARMFSLDHKRIGEKEYFNELVQRPSNGALDLEKARGLGLSLFSLNAGLRELKKWRIQSSPQS